MEDKYSASSGVKSKDMETAGFVTEFFSHIDKYVAPKYAYQYGMLNNRCDGDSFGMLILERISGQSGRFVENDGGRPWSDQIVKLTPEVKPSSWALTRALMVAFFCYVS